MTSSRYLAFVVCIPCLTAPCQSPLPTPSQDADVLQQRSGQTTAALYYVQSYNEMHASYRKLHDKIRDLVETRGGQIRGRGQGAKARGKKAFKRKIMKALKLLKRKQAHACPICHRLVYDKKRRDALQARLTGAVSDCQQRELEQQIDECSKFITFGEFHQVCATTHITSPSMRI